MRLVRRKITDAHANAQNNMKTCSVYELSNIVVNVTNIRLCMRNVTIPSPFHNSLCIDGFDTVVFGNRDKYSKIT